MSNLILSEPVKLFGGYVENATVNVGYGSQSSTCQISLVYDGDGPKTKEDYTLNFPKLGTCVGFKFGELEFVGIFQKWTENKDIGGYRYDIILESASKVLDGVNVILEGFQGSAYPRFGAFTNEISNVWNIFAELENYAYGGIFGGANTNSAGFIGVLGLTMMEQMSRGELLFGGPISYGESTFHLDLSELRQAILSLSNPDFYRIDGQYKTVSAIIEEACSLIMYDYIVEIIPRSGEVVNGPIEESTIIIRMIDKSKPPDLTVIRGAIKRYEQAGELVSSNFGQELTNTVTQKLVMGGPASRYTFIEGSQLTQLWGKTKGHNSQYTTKIVLDDGREYPPNISNGFGRTSTVTTPDIMEVRAAMHSFDSWILWHIIRRQLLSTTQNQSYSNAIVDFYSLFTCVDINQFHLDAIANGTIGAIDLIDTSINSAKKRNQVTTGTYVYEELQKLHNSVKNAGEEYWGRKYYVTLPIEPGGKANNLKFTSEDFQYINTWEMADSAWHEYPTPYGDISFYDGEGRLKTTANWKYDPKNYDYTNLGNGYCFGGKGGIGSVVNVEKDIYWTQQGGFGASVAQCVIDLPAVAIFDKYTTEHNALFHFLQLYYGYTNNQLDAIFNIGSDSGSTIYGISPDRARPINVGIAQTSTRFRWGPWWNYKSFNGASEVIIEESLTPETFGGIDNMSSYGTTYAQVANAEVSGVESGSLELAGAPIGNIGRRFLVSGPYVTSINVTLGIGGVTTSYSFNTWTPQFGKLTKYNADRLANSNKNLFRFIQDKRSKLEARAFQPQKYKEYSFKGNRPLLIQQNGSLAIGMQYAGLPGDETFRMDANAGALGNQLNAVAKNPDKVHVVSLEQLYSPIFVAKNPKEEDVDVKPTTQEPVDNYSDTVASLFPTSESLSPYFKHPKTDFNHTVMNEGEIEDVSIKRNTVPVDSVQSVGLRGPLLMSGWGVGADMKKIPFDTDITEYKENVGQNRSLWKSGPVDLRWDEERKTWGSGFDFIEGFLKEDMEAATSKTQPAKFKVDVYRNKDKTIEADGLSETVSEIKWQSTGEEVTGINRGNKTGSTGDYVLLMRINYEWRPVDWDC